MRRAISLVSLVVAFGPALLAQKKPTSSANLQKTKEKKPIRRNSLCRSRDSIFSFTGIARLILRRRNLREARKQVRDPRKPSKIAA